jgi:hypothetical protein
MPAKRGVSQFGALLAGAYLAIAAVTAPFYYFAGLWLMSQPTRSGSDRLMVLMGRDFSRDVWPSIVATIIQAAMLYVIGKEVGRCVERLVWGRAGAPSDRTSRNGEVGRR